MREITLVQLNDLHGYMVAHSEWMWSPAGFRYQRMGGLARIKRVVDELIQANRDVLFLDNGDTFHGTRAVVQSRGACLAPVMNRMGLAAMTGHWDFAYGPKHLVELLQGLSYPFLAANIYTCDGGGLMFQPTTTITLGSTRVGIIGLACNIVDKVMPPHFSEGIRFTDGVKELPGYIEQLREREHCDLIVLLSHLGLPQDLELVGRVPGVDVCLSSHTHNRLEKPITVGRTLVIQSGCHGSFLGMLKVRVGPDGTSLAEHRLIPITEDLDEDPEIKVMVDDMLRNDNIEPRRFVGHTENALNRATMLESTADNLLLDAMRSATGAQLAFINGWRFGAPIPQGDMTSESLYNLAPMDPEITTVDLNGAELWEMIEENLERTFSRDPFDQMGGYVKRCGGMTTFFKAENPNGTRVQEIFVGEERLKPDQRYTAAFVTIQAVPAKYGANRRDTGVHLIRAAEAYLQTGPYTGQLRGSFVEV